MYLADISRFGNGVGAQNFDERYFNHPMMLGAGSGTPFWIFGFLWLFTWLLIIAVLLALLRWLWKKGDGERKRK